jgi:hypothetical protein
MAGEDEILDEEAEDDSNDDDEDRGNDAEDSDAGVVMAFLDELVINFVNY